MHDIPEEAVKAVVGVPVSGPYLSKAEAVEIIEAALPFLPVQWAVKKMAWIRPPLSDTLSRCDTDFGTYRTWTHDEANGKWFWSVEGGWNEANGEAPNEEAAKAAAQQDYEARILSALEPSAADMGNLITDKTVKRRIADALEYVWSALDCDVEHIDSIIAHMQGNGLRIIETGLTVSDADFNGEVGIPATELSTASKMEVVGDLQELLERLDAGLEYEGWMETDGAPVELFDIEAAQDLFADAAAAIRALSSPDHADAGKVEGDGWKPIESAPRDGTSILAVCAGVHERTGIPFIPEVVEWTQFGWSNEMWGEQPNHGGYYPTHWRPLPSAPSQEVAGS